MVPLSTSLKLRPNVTRASRVNPEDHRWPAKDDLKASAAVAGQGDGASALARVLVAAGDQAALGVPEGDRGGLIGVGLRDAGVAPGLREKQAVVSLRVDVGDDR
jgi:hypothetical protein